MTASSAGEAATAYRLADGLAAAARAVGRVLAGASLDAAFSNLPQGRVRAAAQDYAYGALRAYGRVDALADRLLDKPMPRNELYALLLVALHALDTGKAEHTLVTQAVDAAGLLGLPQARGLVNAVLRNALRRRGALERELERLETARHHHPQWWIDRVRSSYPEQWSDVLHAANDHPPMTLRVNARRTSPEAYVERLREAGFAARVTGPQAVLLGHPMPVEALPGFAAGEVSVQDAGAQQAAPLLDAEPGMRVLDACAAPGGKTCHVLELVECDLTALDLSQARMGRVEQNLKRLGLSARMLVGDAAQVDQLLPGQRFDRILLDAPCSASGVVRRHPDIKWLRRDSDVAAFAALQSRLLDALWRVLAPNGRILYATCSVFPEENEHQVRAFLARRPDARRLPLSGQDGQILPSATSDGFYYSVLARIE